MSSVPSGGQSPSSSDPHFLGNSAVTAMLAAGLGLARQRIEEQARGHLGDEIRRFGGHGLTARGYRLDLLDRRGRHEEAGVVAPALHEVQRLLKAPGVS